LKYSPILKEVRTKDVFTKDLEPIGDEYSQFGMRIPDLKKFCILITDLSYFLTLSLQGNLVDDEMIKWLVPGLITNQTLRHLDLSNNRITGKGMVKLCSFLVRTKALLSINLVNNLIGGDSSYAIGLVIKENTKLKVMLLGMNRFDDESGARIIKMLSFNTYLNELDLSTNQLGEESMKNLQIALKTNTNIKKINLCHNELQVNEEVIKAAENHPLLIELDLHHTISNEKLIKELDSILVKKAVKLQLAQIRGK
jgi:Ran GTPase-activating protein (RanGAP) involved in mRNA processing and transport